jgi:uncharacterized protein
MVRRALLVFLLIVVGTTAAIAIVTARMGWTVTSPAWGVLGTLAMWAPAVGSIAARRVAGRPADVRLPLNRWGSTGIQVVLWPLVVPLVVYGVSYVVAWSAGIVHWSPGGGKWTSDRQIAANLLVNIPILAVFGTVTAMGEEIGWRGFLQPFLDACGVRASIVVVCLCQLAYHAPLMAGSGYADVGGLVPSLALFFLGDLPLTFIWTHEAYRAGSLWPAVFFHSFHNSVSQWLFPKFFITEGSQPWLQGEAGLFPMVGYLILGGALFVWIRSRGQSWASFARTALSQRHP